MRENELDTPLRAKQQELESILRRMEATRVEIENAAAEFASEWYPAAAKREVETDGGITEKLSDHQLGGLKRRVAALTESAKDLVNKAFAGQNTWWHRRESLAVPDGVATFEYSTRALADPDAGPEVIMKALRVTLGQLGPLLREYGYLNEARGSQNSEWNKLGNYGRPVPYYPHYLPYPATIRPLVERYSDDYERALAIVVDIQKIRNDYRRIQSARRWDES